MCKTWVTKKDRFAQGYIENVETKMGMNETSELDP